MSMQLSWENDKQIPTYALMGSQLVHRPGSVGFWNGTKAMH